MMCRYINHTNQNKLCYFELITRTPLYVTANIIYTLFRYNEVKKN